MSVCGLRACLLSPMPSFFSVLFCPLLLFLFFLHFILLLPPPLDHVQLGLFLSLTSSLARIPLPSHVHTSPVYPVVAFVLLLTSRTPLSPSLSCTFAVRELVCLIFAYFVLRH